MKKNIMLGALAIVAVVAVAFFLFNDGGTAWIEDWLPASETNQGITGKWFIEPYVVYDDGSREALKAGAESLWVKHGTQQVSTIEYVLKAQATRDEAQGSFQSVEVDVSNLKLNAAFDPDFAGPSSGNVWKNCDGTVSIPFNSGSSTTDITEVATFTIPVDIDGSADASTGIPLPNIPSSNMNEFTNGWQEGTWTVTYSAQGSVQFRGTNADFGDGGWQDTNLPQNVMHFIDVGQYTVTVDWDSEVTYN